MARITFHFNGVAKQVDVDSSAALVYVLRYQLGLTADKIGCEQCGSCAVLVDGRARLSCVAPVGQFEGTDIVTVEGLTSGQGLAPVQEAFVEEAAAQCGYCTLGLLIAVEALPRRANVPDEAELQEAPIGHLCCGTRAAGMPATKRVLQERGAK